MESIIITKNEGKIIALALVALANNMDHEDILSSDTFKNLELKIEKLIK